MNRSQSVHLRLSALFVALALVAAACGGGDDAAPTEAPADDPTTAPTEAAVAETEAAVAETTAPADEPKPAPTPELPTAEPTTEPPATLEPAATPEASATPAGSTAPTAEPLDAGDEVADAGESMGSMGGEATYAEYASINDDTGAITVDVPAEWGDVDGRPFTDDQGRQLFDVRAAPDLEAFANGWDVPGIIVTASTELAQTENEVTLLDSLVEPLTGQCDYLGRQPYDDGLYSGQADVFENCGGTETGYLVIGAVPNTRAFVIVVQVQVTQDRDIEALGRAIETFLISGDV